ncbi:MAG: hypothetical protein ACYTGK_18725, partial [Planctomycetota bacterium]
MAVLRTLRRLPGRLLRQLARKNTSDILALDLRELDTAPDLRGWELTVVSSDLGAAKVRSLIEGSLPRKRREEFITTVARGGLLYMLHKNDRIEHYSWVGLTETHRAHFVAEPGDAISWNSWTIQHARGDGLFGLSLKLMGWHLKQQGYRRVLGAVETWNEPSWKGTHGGGLECVGRYTLWTLFGCVFLRVDHAARGRQRCRLFFGLNQQGAPKL